jgi:hypothetical protein
MCRWKYNGIIKMDPVQLRCESVDWIGLVEMGVWQHDEEVVLF